MDTTEFGTSYLQYEASIVKVLRGMKIYDEDLLHDTYIALYEHSQKAEIGAFVNTFVAFYKNQYDWQNIRESYCETYEHNQLAALHIIDETEGAPRVSATAVG